MILAVEINDDSINIVQASVRKGRPLDLRCVREDISKGVEDGVILDTDYVSDRMKEIFQKNGISVRKTVFVINSKSLIVRRLRLPILKKSNEARSMIGYELRQYIPFDAVHYRMHYETVLDKNNERYAWYIVYCIPEELIESYKTLATKAKLRPVGFEIYCSCVNKLRNLNEDTYALVDIGEERISLTVMNNGISDLSRIVEVDHVGTKSPLDQCIDEIIRCMRYYQSADKESEIKRMYIYNSKIGDQLNAFIERMHYAFPDVEIVTELPVFADKLSYCDGGYFMTVIATCNEGRGSYKLNRTKNRETSDFRTAAAMAVILLSSLLFIFGGIFALRLYREYEYMKEYISNDENILLNNEIERLKAELRNNEKNAADIEALKNRVNAESYIDSKIFRGIFSVAPENTHLRSIYVGASGVSVECTSQSIDEAATFIGSLRELSAFEDIFVDEVSIKDRSEEGYDYTIQCILRDVDYEE